MSEEKMRDYQWQQAGWIASWMKRHAINLEAEPFAELQDHLAALRTHENGGQESGSVQDAVDKFSALLADCTESERQQARAIFCEVLGVGGQESEAGAVAWLHEIVEPDGYKTGMFSFKPDNPWSHWMESHKEKCQYTKTPLFLAPPSAQAIETAAIMKCVEVAENSYVVWSMGLPEGNKALCAAIGRQLRALIPQDGRTQLEEFGLKVADRVYGHFGVDPDRERKEALLEAAEIAGKAYATFKATEQAHYRLSAEPFIHENFGFNISVVRYSQYAEDELRRMAEGEKE